MVITDYQMKNMDGIELRDLIRDGNRNIPIILMTAKYDSTDDAKKGLNAGADEYVVKPFLNRIMLANVKHLLGEIHHTKM